MLNRLLIALPAFGVGTFAGLVAGLAFAGALQPPSRSSAPRSLPRITNYSSDEQVLRHLGKPNSVTREGNTQRLQWYGLASGSMGWQLDLFLSANTAPRVAMR